MLLTFKSSAAVTGVPFGRVKGLVTSFKVRLTGSVAVVPAGITLLIITVMYPTGCILRTPRAILIFSVPIVVLVLSK
jgi:hypothetical protein